MGRLLSRITLFPPNLFNHTPRSPRAKERSQGQAMRCAHSSVLPTRLPTPSPPLPPSPASTMPLHLSTLCPLASDLHPTSGQPQTSQ